MANYGQLFAQALARPSLTDTLNQAKGLAQTIGTYQKQQRVAPIIAALQQFANNYNTATTDEQRQQANTMNNQIRGNYIAGGGSPVDLPTNLWGSNPSQGFQTANGFQAPITGYEGLGRKDIMTAKRQTQADELSRRQTEAELTGIDPLTGQKTWGRQYQEAALTKSGSGGSSGSSTGKTLTERQNAAYADAIDAVNLAAAEGFSNEEIKANIDSQSAELIRMGIDPEKVKEYVDSQVLTKEALEEQKKEKEKERLDTRPFWQKAVDTVVPGAQYR